MIFFYETEGLMCYSTMKNHSKLQIKICKDCDYVQPLVNAVIQNDKNLVKREWSSGKMIIRVKLKKRVERQCSKIKVGNMWSLSGTND